jgi:hypothetical protein
MGPMSNEDLRLLGEFAATLAHAELEEAMRRYVAGIWAAADDGRVKYSVPATEFVVQVWCAMLLEAHRGGQQAIADEAAGVPVDGLEDEAKRIAELTRLYQLGEQLRTDPE